MLMELRLSRPTGMRAFTIVWIGQLISLLGTGMTQFALNIWAWQITGQATALALGVFFSFAPTILFSPVAGVLIDRWDRKLVMMISDLTALAATTVLLLLYLGGNLQIWHLYATGAFIGIFQAFQWPAYGATISTMLPKEQYARANGMLSLANSISNIGSPILASILIVGIGIGGILIFDIVTFVLAIASLMAVHIPQPAPTKSKERSNIWRESAFGFRYILNRPSLLGLQLLFFALNLVTTFAMVLLTPMILARTGNDETILGAVQSSLGMGGVIGGVLLSVWGGPKRRVHGIFMGMTLASLGILGMGLGRSTTAWIACAFFMLLVAPFIDGSNQAIWQAKVEPAVQGRVFATRRMLAQISAPLVMLLAGPLADHVFEPAMREGSRMASILGPLVGVGPGAGMAVMFIIGGALGALVGLSGYLFPVVRDVETIMPDHKVKPEERESEVVGAALEKQTADAV
jgi:MFS transporter, DHA3 family, macrolide efflux protein